MTEKEKALRTLREALEKTVVKFYGLLERVKEHPEDEQRIREIIMLTKKGIKNIDGALKKEEESK